VVITCRTEQKSRSSSGFFVAIPVGAPHGRELSYQIAEQLKGSPMGRSYDNQGLSR